LLRADSFDHLVRAQEDRRWQRHAHGLGSLEIDDDLETVDLFERQISGLRPAQNLRDKGMPRGASSN
jgi:hypothetical protein